MRDLPDTKIFCVGVRKIESAHTRAGMHRRRFSESNPSVVLGIKQIEQCSFLGMIGTSGIARSRPDAAIFFADEIGMRQLLVSPKSPGDASLFMQIFGKRFG